MCIVSLDLEKCLHSKWYRFVWELPQLLDEIILFLPQQMKEAITHFQCAAGAYTYLDVSHRICQNTTVSR